MLDIPMSGSSGQCSEHKSGRSGYRVCKALNYELSVSPKLHNLSGRVTNPHLGRVPGRPARPLFFSFELTR